VLVVVVMIDFEIAKFTKVTWFGTDVRGSNDSTFLFHILKGIQYLFRIYYQI
jgi:hypothetical protein